MDGFKGHIIDMKHVGRYKLMVIVNNFLKANLLLEKINSESALYRAYIPKHLISITGVLAGIPVYITDEEILDYLECKVPVLDVRRLYPNEGKDKIPLSRVCVTFRTNLLPERAKLFCCATRVLPFIRKVDLCEKCLRYGHRTMNCKGARRCKQCGERHNEGEFENCQGPQKCANCK